MFIAAAYRVHMQSKLPVALDAAGASLAADLAINSPDFTTSQHTPSKTEACMESQAGFCA
jgi:hypothetical protein